MNCRLIGSFVQHLEIELMPGEYFYAQKGALICMDSGIEKSLSFSGGGLRGLVGAKLSGESLLIMRFVNRSNQSRRLILGSAFGIVPVKIQSEDIICHKGAYIASNESVKVSIKISISGWMGGMGMLLQKISGTATIFLDSIGQPIVRELQYGESIEIDENHIIALQGIKESQMSASWSLKNALGGEGWSLLKVNGPGKVYLSPGAIGPMGISR